ncbi:PREDICTED: 39S ribosomal protein L53, mitochondrial [Chaetura pelagica]|uniref:39S ribosomal protein L53, mitochondrial n=1 Tax=Chaetura pelagica TaxID=8897 RepID=UPI000523A4E9|nr:PREDICTED: 39S ribosomal protein L53, mitochondrial [Chaetura pelagica]
MCVHRAAQADALSAADPVVRVCNHDCRRRKFLACIYHKRIQSTNRNCEITADVRHDGSEPLVDVMFADGERLLMKGANLTTIEMLTALGSRCNAKELKEEQKSKKKSP